MLKSVAQAISAMLFLVEFFFFEVFLFSDPTKCGGKLNCCVSWWWRGIVCNAHERYIGFKDETPQWPDTLVSSRRPHLFVFVFISCGALYTLFHSRFETHFLKNLDFRTGIELYIKLYLGDTTRFYPVEPQSYSLNSSGYVNLNEYFYSAEHKSGRRQCRLLPLPTGYSRANIGKVVQQKKNSIISSRGYQKKYTLSLSSEREEKGRSRFGSDKVNQAQQDARGLWLDGVIIIIIIIIMEAFYSVRGKKEKKRSWGKSTLKLTWRSIHPADEFPDVTSSKRKGKRKGEIITVNTFWCIK